MDIRFNNDRNLTYSASYTPKVEGQHKVTVLYAGREIPKSPYVVSVEGHAGDASKVTASGPGIEPEGVVVGRPTYFDIFTKGNSIRNRENRQNIVTSLAKDQITYATLTSPVCLLFILSLKSLNNASNFV